MKILVENGEILRVENSIPITFEYGGSTYFNYNMMSEADWIAHGWKDLYKPELAIGEQYGPIVYMAETDSYAYTIEQKPITSSPVLTPLAFLNRFTDDEAKTIMRLTKQSEDVELWWLKYNKAQDIDLSDPQTIGGVQALEAAGILGEGRAAVILTY